MFKPIPTSGAELADLRDTAGVKQWDLARELGIDASTLSKYERQPTLDTGMAERSVAILQRITSERKSALDRFAVPTREEVAA